MSDGRKRIPSPGAVVRYEGELHEVIAIAEGRTITLRSLERGPCIACGRSRDVELLERSPIFQDRVTAVETIESGPSVTGTEE